MTGPDAGRVREVLDGPTWFARITILIYIVALIGAEATAFLFSIEISLACYSALLLLLLNHSALVSVGRPETGVALASLALLPLLKIGAVVLPQQAVPNAYWEAFPAALALATLVLLRKGDPAAGDVPLWPKPSYIAWGIQFVIAATGPLLAVAAALVLYYVDRGTGQPGIGAEPATVLVVAVFSGFTLEIVFRGAVQGSFVRLFGPLGIVLASLLYAGLFLGSGSGLIVLLGLATGLFWGILAASTRTVSGVAMSHGLFSLSWVLLY